MIPRSLRTGSVRPIVAAALGISAFLGSVFVAQLLTANRSEPVNTSPPVTKPTASGQMLYQTHCANCHGFQGHGDGSGAIALDPAPRDFASPRWRFGTNPTVMRTVIAQGIAGTGMPGFAASLSADQLASVTEYVRTLASDRDETTVEFQSSRVATTEAGFAPTDLPLPLPSFLFRDAAERAITPADVRGKAVLFVFWATDCVHCLKEFPAIATMAKEFQNRGLIVIGICSDATDAEEAASIVGEPAKTLRIGVDAAGVNLPKFDVQAYPTFVLVDAEGRIVGRKVGATDWSTIPARRLISACLPRSESRTAP